jgi:protoheme IX farnesyltransferase
MGVALPAGDVEARPRLVDLVALGKPRVTFMVLVTALGGMWLSPMPLLLGPTLLALTGIGLVVYGANALNMYLERDVDALMTRTRDRPLPAGRMQPEVALRAGLLASVLAIGLLTFGVNPLTGLLASLSLLLYVLFYTPFKRRSTLALLVGAVPGAAPPLLGWTAATGRIDPGGLALFTILFIWQIPHFHAISLFRREEYARAGLKVMPEVRGVLATKMRIVLYAAVLGTATVPAYAAGLSSSGYLWVAAPLSFAFLLLTLAGLRAMDDASERRWARRVFFATLLHLPIVLGALVYFRR